MATRQTSTSETVVESPEVASAVLTLKPQPTVTNRCDYKPPEYFIKNVLLSFLLDPEQTVVEAELDCYRNANSPHGANMVLVGEDLQPPENVTLNDKVLKVGEGYTMGEGNKELIIAGGQLPVKSDEIFRIHTRVIIAPTDNLQLSGLYMTKGMYITQCEAEGFRRITYFLDRPDVLSTYQVRIQGRKDEVPTIVAGGNLVASGVDSETPDEHFVYYDDPIPRPCYLFGLVAGKYGRIKDTFTTMSGKAVEVQILADEKDIGKLNFAMESIKKAMRWDEVHYGREYDLGTFTIVAAADFNMGAMENKGLNIFNSALLLADVDMSTDADFVRIAGVIAHEYFHNWTGNRVTCRDWFQITLKEGLTVYRDQSFTRTNGGGDAKRIEDVLCLRARQFNEDGGPLSHPIRPESYVAVDNFYTSTVYEKGAEVVRMYSTILGADGFRKGMDLYFERHDGKAVTCDDFLAAMSDANGHDLTQFARWYSTKGTPTIAVLSESYNADTKEYKVEIEQRPPHNAAPLHIPIRLGLIGKESHKETLSSTVVNLKEAKQTFSFVGISEDSILSILRDFSAPVRLEFDRSDSDLLLLMECDTDAFCRYEAAQILYKKIIMERIEKKYNEGSMETLSTEAPPLPQKFLKAIRSILIADDLDMSFQSFVLLLPPEGLFLQETNNANTDDIYWARCSLKRQIFERLHADFTSTYTKLSAKLAGKPYSHEPEDIGLRSLRLVCLSFIATIHNDENTQLVKKHFDESTNMTDRYTAFNILLNMTQSSNTAVGVEALSSFFERAKDNDLLLDKWFAAQSRVSYPNVIETIRSLSKHSLFTMKNPNRMRALFGAFTSNQYQFHRPDGQGYEMVADCILELDGFNEQIAARMCRELTTNYGRLEPKRRELLKAQLDRVLAKKDLSSMTYEVASAAVR